MAAREEIERLMTLAGKLSALGIDKAGCLQEMIDLQQRLAAELAALRAVAEAARAYATPAFGIVETTKRLDALNATLAALDKVREAGG